MKNSKRKPISKSLRFEVFKRDSFRCQYCGSEAPAVVLHVDHIVAVAKGGDNDVTNLITSCMPCNLGKSDVELSDHAAVAKARVQMDELQERREQLELMMQWRNGLRNIHSETVDKIAEYWRSVVSGYRANENGRAKLGKYLEKFSQVEICDAIDAAVESLEYVDGKATPASVEIAFSKIAGICRVRRAAQTDPDIQELYYIRGILRKRLHYFDPVKALQYLRAARSWDVPMEDLGEMARTVRNWSQFVDWIADANTAAEAAEKQP